MSGHFNFEPIGHVICECSEVLEDDQDKFAATKELDERNFSVAWLCGLDAIDATPVLDIKPVMYGFEPRGVLREPNWAAEIMSDYWLKQ